MAHPEEEEMSMVGEDPKHEQHPAEQRETPRTFAKWAKGDFTKKGAAIRWAEELELELSALRAKLEVAEKDAERKDMALRVARAAVTLGTTDGGKAVARMIDAAIEKERSRDC